MAVTGKVMAALVVTVRTDVGFRFLCSNARGLAGVSLSKNFLTDFDQTIIGLSDRALFNDAVIS